MSRFDDLITERATLHEANTAILDKVDAEKRDISGEEQQEWDKQYERMETISSELETRQKQADWNRRMTESAGRQTEAAAGSPLTPPAKGADTPGQLHGDNTPFELGGFTVDPGHPAYAILAERASAEYRAAFEDFLGSGHIGAVLKTTDDAAGGSFTTTQMLSQLLKFMDDDVKMRSLATVLPPLRQAISLGVPTLETDPNDADWTPEVPAANIAADTNMTTGKRELVPHLNSKLIEVSLKLLRSSVIPMGELVTSRIAHKHATSEENAFTSGDGSEKPLGVFTASADGISTSRDVDGNGNATTLHPNDFSDVLMNLKEQYQRNATYLLHRDTVKKAMQLVQAEGNYIWQPGLALGMPNTILGRPYVMSEFAPNTFSNGAYVIVCGDFKRGYWIVDSLAFSIQRLTELLARQNLIGFLGRRETDGMPVLEEAFSRLKMTT